MQMIMTPESSPRIIAMQDILASLNSMATLKSYLQAILYGSDPKCILCQSDSHRAQAMRDEEARFLGKEELTDVIEERRTRHGLEIEISSPEGPIVDIDYEKEIARRLSHRVWSLVARHVKPDFFDPVSTSEFYIPVRAGKTIIVDGRHNSMGYAAKWRMIGMLLVRADAVREIYEEAVAGRIRGIGPIGVKDLRALLEPEYQDLA
jgi:hypothetical protein